MQPDELARALAAEFPKQAISWRAQSVTQDGKKALALAYIDARDVMQRLDEVCGVNCWQCKYSHANGKTICDIAIKINGEWIIIVITDYNGFLKVKTRFRNGYSLNQ